MKSFNPWNALGWTLAGLGWLFFAIIVMLIQGCLRPWDVQPDPRAQPQKHTIQVCDRYMGKLENCRNVPPGDVFR